MKFIKRIFAEISWVMLFMLSSTSLLIAVSPTRTGAKMPPVVVDFMKFQQSRYPENEFAALMQQYRLRREIAQTEKIPAIEQVPSLAFKVPVLVGKFSDSGVDQWKTATLEQELFKGPWSTGTMKAFYQEISYQQFDLDGTAYGWYQTANKRDYYGNGVYGLPKQGGRTPEFIRELIAAADASVDFSQYDNDGDGYVETIFIVHYDQGAEGYNDPTSHTNEIWSHQSKLSYWPKQGGAYKTNDKTSTNKEVYIDSYVMQPAISSDGSSMIEIGVFCHEFGHALGLPDLYDYDSSSEGVGHWGLMGSGGWNTPGSPAHMSAWSKVKLGWIIPVLVTHNMTGATLLNVEQNTAVHKLWTYGSYTGKQYFLVENRQALGFDKNLHQPGVLIWHVDESVTDNDHENHKMVDLEEADGANDLDYATNRGDNGDAYPGVTNNTAFDNTSNPNSRDYSSNNTHCEVRNISASATTMTADLIVGTPELKVMLVVKDGATDNGNEPSPCDPWWTESEIWIDNDSDGKADLPAKGMDNLLWAQVFNFGTEDAANVKVKFYQSYPALGLLFPSKAKFIDEATISLIQKNQGSGKISVKWNLPQPPPQIDHYCVGVIAENDKDKPAQEKSRYDNNLAQINYIYLVKKAGQVTPTTTTSASSTAGFVSKFIIYNPKDRRWSYHIEIDPNTLQLPAGWYASVTPDFVTLNPDERQEGLLTISVRRVQHGDRGQVSLVLRDYEYRTIEGGITFVCMVDDVPPVPPPEFFAASYFDSRDRIQPDDPTVCLNWRRQPEDVYGQPESIVYYKIYRASQPGFSPDKRNLVDSTAIDAEPDISGFQWYDTIDLSTGPFYYALTAVDAAGNESGTSNISAVQVGLAGHVIYYVPRPVSGAQLLLDGMQSQLTNFDGFFEFFNVAACPHHLEVSKTDDVRNAIDDADAPILLEHLAFLKALNEFQMLAADVTQNQIVTGADALALLRFMNQLSSFTGKTGNWRFLPSMMDFNLIIQKIAHFTALVLGDVNGSWGAFPQANGEPASRRFSNQPSESFDIQSTAGNSPRLALTKETDPAFKATLAFPKELNFQPGQRIEVPIFVTTNSNIGLAQFTVEYDSTLLGLVRPIPAPGAPGFNISAVNLRLPFRPSARNVNRSVLVQIVGGGVHYFTGVEQPICFLVFGVLATHTQSSPLIFDRHPDHTFLTTDQLEDLRDPDLDFIDGNVNTTALDDVHKLNTPTHFALDQNYPNPFNSETRIHFAVKAPGRVRLTLYDLIGRQIRTLVDQEFLPGFYQLALDARELSSGIYFYRIQTGDFQAIRKMILIE